MQYILDLRYVKLLAYKCAIALQNTNEESHKHRYAYYYGFQFIFGLINEILLLWVASAILGVTGTTMLTALVFASIRVFAGGLHLKSYTKCAYFSLLVLLTAGLLGELIQFSIIINIIIFSAVLLSILKYAVKKGRLISIIILSVWFVINLFTNSMAIAFGVMITGIIVLPVINSSAKYL